MGPEFDELLDRAAGLCDEGSFASARDLVRQVLDEEPENARAWTLLARVDLGEGHDDLALDAARRAGANSSDSALPRVLACIACVRLGRFDAAIEHLREGVRVDPFDWRPLALLGRLLAQDAATLGEARELTVRALKLAPDEPQTVLAAGAVAAAAGDREAAQRAFRRVLALDPASSVAQHELARLRLRRRLNDPAVLAEAASGFARAARSDPEAERSRRTLELVLRAFLCKTAYFLLIDAFVVGRLTASSNVVAARLLPVGLLLIPGFYAWRFCSGLTPTVLRQLQRTIVGQRPLQFAAGCETLAVACIIAAAAAPQSARTGFAGTAALFALIGRVVIYTQVEHASRAVRGEPSRPAVSAGFLWIVAVLVALTSAGLLLAVVRAGAGPVAVPVALIFAVASVMLGRAARRRPDSKHASHRLAAQPHRRP